MFEIHFSQGISSVIGLRGLVVVNARNHDSAPRPKISLRTAINSFPSAFMVVGLLIVALVLDIVGMAVYMVLVPKANEGPFIILCALFILVYVPPLLLTRYGENYGG